MIIRNQGRESKVLNYACQFLWFSLSVWMECWGVPNLVGLNGFKCAPFLKSVQTCEWKYKSSSSHQCDMKTYAQNILSYQYAMMA